MPTTAQIQDMYAQFTNGVQVTVWEQNVTVRSNNVPPHQSPYFSAGHSLYEAPHAGMALNPNTIIEQNVVFQLPITFMYAAPADTPMGPIGLAVNGVNLYNQYAAFRAPLTNEILSFDRFNGRPDPGRVLSPSFGATLAYQRLSQSIGWGAARWVSRVRTRGS
jgi:hypothetical protein